MLRGRFGDTSGRPYMEGHVLFPRLGWSGNVSFIFDTGADASLLMPLDAERMGIDYAMLENEVSALGIGGVSENFIESAYLAFYLSMSCRISPETRNRSESGFAPFRARP